MNVDAFAQQVDVIRAVVDEPRSAGKAASRWLSVVNVFLEELDVAIEELREQNEELRLNQHLIGKETERYRDLFNLAPEGYLVTNELGVIIEANRAACEALHISPIGLEGKPLSVYVDPADRRAFRRLLHDVGNDRSSRIIELRIQPRDRLSFDAEFTVQAAASRSEESIELRWVLRNVTGRNRRVKEMRAMVSALQTRVDSNAGELRDLLQSLDGKEVDHSILSETDQVARSQKTALTSTKEALSAALDVHELLDVLLSAIVPTVGDWAIAALVNEEGTLSEAAAVHRDPHALVRLSALLTGQSANPGSLVCHGHSVLKQGMPQFSPKGEPLPTGVEFPRALSWMAVDPTDLSLMCVPLRSRGQIIGVLEVGRESSRSSFDSDDLAYALELTGPSSLAVDNARLFERSQVAVAAREQFLSVAAHELRTPITVVRGYAQILTRRFSGDRAIDAARAVRMAREIEKQADHLASLVDQLVDVSRAESGNLALRPESANVSAIVMHQVELAQLTTDRHSFATSIDPEILADVDTVRFEQVVSNLLDNAIKFSLDGGLIDVSLTRTPEDKVQFTVSDRGVGVDPAHRARIFDRFYQAHGRADIRGLGLGLFISREIMRLHGGDLQAQFPSNGDTMFVAELPIFNSSVA
ncbi:MAG: ATP-binding protein [Nitrolancea sp.]